MRCCSYTFTEAFHEKAIWDAKVDTTKERKHEMAEAFHVLPKEFKEVSEKALEGLKKMSATAHANKREYKQVETMEHNNIKLENGELRWWEMGKHDTAVEALEKKSETQNMNKGNTLNALIQKEKQELQSFNISPERKTKLLKRLITQIKKESLMSQSLEKESKVDEAARRQETRDDARLSKAAKAEGLLRASKAAMRDENDSEQLAQRDVGKVREDEVLLGVTANSTNLYMWHLNRE